MRKKTVVGTMIAVLLICVLALRLGDRIELDCTVGASLNNRVSSVEGLAERHWSFENAREWGAFACADEDSAELIIGVNDAVKDVYARLDLVIVENKGRIVNTIPIRGVVKAIVADVPFDWIPPLVSAMKAAGLERYVEPNMKVQADFVPNDPYWSLQWGPQKIEANVAWDTAIGSPSVLVAVVDTGVDYLHPIISAPFIVCITVWQWLTLAWTICIRILQRTMYRLVMIGSIMTMIRGTTMDMGRTAQELSVQS